MNGIGHTILFQVALDRMTPTARNAVTQLLTNYSSNPEEGGFQTPSIDGYLPTQAEYPDQWLHMVNHHADGSDGEGGRHYDNHPIGPAAQGHPDDNNGTEQFEQQLAIAQNPGTEPNLRANALRWVIHEFGDVGAQPLHTVNRFTPEHPKGDEGGNLFPLKWGGTGRWDDCLHSLIDDGGAHPDPADPAKAIDNYDEANVLLPLNANGVAYIQQKAKDIEAKYPIALDDPQVLDLNSRDWAKTLGQQATDQIYGALTPGETLAPSDPKLNKIESMMDQNVSLAGARLAAWANATFAEAPAA